MFGRSLVRYASEPVSQIIFDDILSPICRGKNGLGLAISGGVDSMALATLCATVRNFAKPPITAFIVDHRLRPGSTEEAQSVANILLDRLRIPSRILTVDWKDIPDPSQARNLESAARRMRFQALGRACADANIDTLLLAHHADDQAETVLSRIHSGYMGTGLKGIQPKMPIGECHGIHRASKSGTIRRLDDIRNSGSAYVESGGVVVHRPLLSFTKSELIETCLANDVKWHEDATNADETLTPRNAIRKMLQSNAMPSALSSDRLRMLAASKWSNLAWCEETAAVYFDYCQTELDPKSSSVTFEIHTGIEHRLSRAADSQLMAAILVRKFFSLVEDQENLALRDLDSAVGFIFPSVFGQWQKSSDRVNVGNVTLVEDPSTREINTDQKRYLIFPRPVRAPGKFTQTLLEVTEQNQSVSRQPVWTETKLFHDRWWIKLRYVPADVPIGTSVVIRFLRKGESIKTGDVWLPKPGLTLLPPAKLRNAIPVIVETREVKDQAGVISKQETLLAFPSIGLTRPACSFFKGRSTMSSPWEYTCSYKDIDFVPSETHNVKTTSRKKTSSRAHALTKHLDAKEMMLSLDDVPEALDQPERTDQK
ncbi:hypothetical protein E4T48_06467 [Aureobasidium sp. EXF-10727]|nr:hypothetical protein E4T48_06467 [Aureobasidium sp. EXF-10727]